MTIVTCAIIIYEQKILICQRSKEMNLPGKWEFPGGKLEENETEEECLIREIKEELDLDVRIFKSLTTVDYHYEEFSIRLLPFLVYPIEKYPTIALREHQNYEWVLPENLSLFDLAPADVPITYKILSIWNSEFMRH